MSPKKQFKWSSHQPVIQTLLALLEPQFILELGVGNFSTPLLLASDAKKILHIENDQPWLDHVTQQFSNDTRSEFRFHDLGPGVKKSTAWSILPPHWQAQQTQYYQTLALDLAQYTGPRLLFVDHFTCLRVLSINCLADYFDAVIYHDAETPDTYGYQHMRADLAGQFDHWQMRPNSSWTGFLVRRGQLDHARLATHLHAEFALFAQSYGRTVDEFRLDTV